MHHRRVYHKFGEGHPNDQESASFSSKDGSKPAHLAFLNKTVGPMSLGKASSPPSNRFDGNEMMSKVSEGTNDIYSGPSHTYGPGVGLQNEPATHRDLSNYLNGSISDVPETAKKYGVIGQDIQQNYTLQSPKSYGSSPRRIIVKGNNNIPEFFHGTPFYEGGGEEVTGAMAPFPSVENNWASPANPFTVLQGSLGRNFANFGQAYQLEDDNAQDPPILEELGIDLNEIAQHVKAVLLFQRKENIELNRTDFTGPILILIVLGICLLLTGRMNFSLIYAMEMLGNIAMYLLLNLTSQGNYIEMGKTIVILGYSLLPICLAPIIWTFSRVILKLFCVIFILILVLWSTIMASHHFEQELKMERRKYLLFGPTLLYYLFFAHATTL